MKNSEFIKYTPLLEKEPPKILCFLFVLGVTVSALGDCGSLGSSAMYLKVVMGLCVAASILYLFQVQNIKRLKLCGLFLIFFTIPIAFVLLESLGLWSGKTMEFSYVSRGVQKMVFQAVTIISAVAGAYMLKAKTIDYYFIGLSIGNGLILIIEFIKFGPTNVLTNFSGYLYKIEIHDITFCMGLFILYYIFVKPHIFNRITFIAIAAFFFYMGLKRIALLSIGLSVVIGFILLRLKPKAQKIFVIIVGVLLVVLGYAFIVIITNGTFTEIMNEYEVDMAGRDKIYKYMAQYYNLSPGYFGFGFEYTVSLLRAMKDSGTQIIHVTGIHNDILKQYIELGFIGYFTWMIFVFIVQPLFYSKKFGSKAMIICMITNIYAWCTYMTDNTIYYFFMSMTLRMMLISTACLSIENGTMQKISFTKKKLAKKLKLSQVKKLVDKE